MVTSQLLLRNQSIKTMTQRLSETARSRAWTGWIEMLKREKVCLEAALEKLTDHPLATLFDRIREPMVQDQISETRDL